MWLWVNFFFSLNGCLILWEIETLLFPKLTVPLSIPTRNIWIPVTFSTSLQVYKSQGDSTHSSYNDEKKETNQIKFWNFHFSAILTLCLRTWKSVLFIQLCPTLCDTMVCSLPGSSVQEIFQARILQGIFLTQG